VCGARVAETVVASVSTQRFWPYAALGAVTFSLNFPVASKTNAVTPKSARLSELADAA